MPQVKCKICNKEFHTKPSQQKRGHGIYCSPKCHHNGLRKGKYIKCDTCGKKAWKAPKALKKTKSGKLFCNKSCHMIWKNKTRLSGENHPNWINGQFAGRGIMERSKRKPICVLCKNTEKRVLAVHHKDHNRQNNKLSNLIWLCHNCHHLVHNYDVSLK